MKIKNQLHRGMSFTTVAEILVKSQDSLRMLQRGEVVEAGTPYVRYFPGMGWTVGNSGSKDIPSDNIITGDPGACAFVPDENAE